MKPFWPPAHRHAIETQQPVSAESVARGQQQVIEAQRATIDAVRELCDAEDARTAKVADRLEREGHIDGKTGRPYQIVGSLPTRRIRAILDAAPNETKDQP